MTTYYMEESFREEIKGRRILAVTADSLEDAQNGKFEETEVIKELWEDGNVFDTHLHFETLQEETVELIKELFPESDKCTDVLKKPPKELL
tara:strand:+ start:636 stop:908 length:273 start_codon:yes stop_codon:yes gene_type:complete